MTNERTEMEKLLKLMQKKEIDMNEVMQIIETYRPEKEYSFSQMVYDTLTDELTDEFALPEVENAYAQGSRCERLYNETIRMCWDISKRLNGNDVDTHPDVQLIMDNMLEIQKILCLKMFHYGMSFGKK